MSDDDLSVTDGGFAPISKLPVFLDLSGRRAVLAGGTPGLAWKAELIAAAGAEVLVLTPDPSDELNAVIARPRAAGSIRLEKRDWTPADLAGAAIAVADLDTLQEAADFKAAGVAAGVIVNTIDKGATCDFYFGAIVSRSPIMIGVTTDGTAPILGQSIRRAIELAVPDWLPDWADFARAIRPDVKRRLAPGRQRRAFWEAFAEAAMTRPLDGAVRAQVLDRVEALTATPRKGPGRVYEFVAPPNADCLRICDVKRLQSADVLIEEPGITPGVRAYFRREATRLTLAGASGPGAIEASALTRALQDMVEAGRTVVVIRAARADAICCRGAAQAMQAAQ